jgi:hypothetical protein
VRTPPHPTREQGQLLVVFALALIGFVGTIGLIIDGGSTFVQRRDEQNVADAAAMAAGYAHLLGADPTAAAEAVASANGYQNGVDGTVISVSVGEVELTVSVTRPHRNYFSGLLGFSSWDVSATATVEAGIPNGAFGALPLIFNEAAFLDPTNSKPNHPASFAEPAPGTEDVPQGDDTFNWTLFCVANGSPCNGDASIIEDIIDNSGTETTVWLDDVIGPLNAGAYATLFDALANRVGISWPVAIVADDGAMVGWAMFHLTGSVGGSTKEISGWFESKVNAAPLFISATGGTPSAVFGAYVVKLID